MNCPAGLICPSSYNGLVYAGQPFSATVSARNVGNATTLNYAGSYAHASTVAPFSALGGSSAPAGSSAGSLSGNSVAASAFTAGVATLGNLAYTFTTPPGTPTDIYLRASENSGISPTGDSVSSLRIPASNSVEGGAKVAQGRIRLTNAFGSALTPLSVPVTAQFWTGQVWATSTTDQSTLNTSAVVNNPLPNASGVVSNPTLALSSLSLANGKGSLIFAAPASPGSFDIALNLGATGSSLQSCISSLSGGTAAALPWLRSLNGNCASSYDRDPTARATFGIYAPETRKTIHIRELF